MKKLYVGNLSYQTTEEGLRTLFAQYGEVEAVTIITDRETGRSRGFAFVEMTTDEGAQAAAGALNGKTFERRELNVAEARPREDRGGAGGGRRSAYGGGTPYEDRGGRDDRW